MSIVSNHYPEVVEEVNTGRPAEWGRPPSDQELADMAERFQRGRPAEARPASPPDKMVVRVDALAQYETTVMTFWGFVDAIQRDLATADDLDRVRHLAQSLRGKLDEVMQGHREWARQKWSA